MQYATATAGPRVVQEEGYSGLDGRHTKYASTRATEEGYTGLSGLQITYSSADLQPISSNPPSVNGANYFTIANDSPGTYHTLKDLQI